MFIPVFTSSQQAIDFGKTMKPETVEVLKRLRKETETWTRIYMSTNQLDEGIIMAARAQFYREAIESFEGKINLPEILESN